MTNTGCSCDLAAIICSYCIYLITLKRNYVGVNHRQVKLLRPRHDNNVITYQIGFHCVLTLFNIRRAVDDLAGGGSTSIGKAIRSPLHDYSVYCQEPKCRPEDMLDRTIRDGSLLVRHFTACAFRF